MRQFILQSVAVIFLSCSVLHATEIMAKNTGMRCNQCHKGRNPVLGVMPKLKSKGIRHLVKLITVEGYVPKYNYSKLNYLAATIEANRKKLEGPKSPKKVVEQNSKTSDSETTESKPINKDKISEGKDFNKDRSEKLTPGTNELRQEFASTIDNNAVTLSNNESKTRLKGSDKISASNEQSEMNLINATKSSQKVVTNSKGKVQFKGGKTFILKRPKVKPGTKYDWEQDWSFDDYY